ncbi:MAG: hypothetical protein P4L22_04735 [Candidatus Babeliales bacterium]|nr:hypothetical protein [Candidatus Babeliales bacterium]
MIKNKFLLVALVSLYSVSSNARTELVPYSSNTQLQSYNDNKQLSFYNAASDQRLQAYEDKQQLIDYTYEQQLQEYNDQQLADYNEAQELQAYNDEQTLQEYNEQQLEESNQQQAVQDEKIQEGLQILRTKTNDLTIEALGCSQSRLIKNFEMTKGFEKQYFAKTVTKKLALSVLRKSGSKIAAGKKIFNEWRKRCKNVKNNLDAEIDDVKLELTRIIALELMLFHLFYNNN